MEFVHSALCVSSVEAASAFYEELLGLPLVREYTGRKELMNRLFGLERDFPIRLYDAGGAFLEVFVGAGSRPGPDIIHVCLKLADRKALCEKAREMGFRVLVVEREGRQDLVFVYDSDGNGFEIKE